jgi:hypothetical protein
MSKKYSISDKHVVDEVLEHVILEKKGLLKGHHNHFLPKKKKEKVKKEKKPLKLKDIPFFLVAYSLLALEFWLFYLGITHHYYSW